MVGLIIAVRSTGQYVHVTRFWCWYNLLFTLNVIVFYRPFFTADIFFIAGKLCYFYVNKVINIINNGFVLFYCFTDYMQKHRYDPSTVDFIARIPLLVTREIFLLISIVFIDIITCSTQLWCRLYLNFVLNGCKYFSDSYMLLILTHIVVAYFVVVILLLFCLLAHF